MLEVSCRIFELHLRERKGLAARSALVAARELAMQATSGTARESVGYQYDGQLLAIQGEIRSQDSERLDQYVQRLLGPLPRPHHKTPEYRCPDCVACAHSADAACSGGNHDARRVREGGACVDHLRMASSLAEQVAQAVYAATNAYLPLPCRVAVTYEVGADCPANGLAQFCVGGHAKYNDTAAAHETAVTLSLGLTHWTLDSYAALAVVLAHELVCHAAHRSLASGPRKSTANTNRFVEGWMDFVARRSLLSHVQRARDLPPALGPVTMARVAGVLAAWRRSDSPPDGCARTRRDNNAADRRHGEDRASEALSLFAGIEHADAFTHFSASFNVSDVNEVLCRRLLEDVEAAYALGGGYEQHIVHCFSQFAKNRDLVEFMSAWQAGVSEDA